MEMLFSCPRCTGAHLASQNQLFGSLAENGRFLNKPLIWKCYFPVPAALVPIWRPKIGIWEPCRKWLISESAANMEMLFSCPRCTGGAHLASQNRNLGALPKIIDFLISR